MTDALRMAGFAAAAALMAFLLRPAHQQAGAAVSLAAGAMVLFAALSHLGPAVEALQNLSRKAGLGDGTVATLLRLIAIAYLSEFAAQACQDAGESGPFLGRAGDQLALGVVGQQMVIAIAQHVQVHSGLRIVVAEGFHFAGGGFVVHEILDLFRTGHGNHGQRQQSRKHERQHLLHSIFLLVYKKHIHHAMDAFPAFRSTVIIFNLQVRVNNNSD